MAFVDSIFRNIKSCNHSCIEYLKQCYICIITLYGMCIQEIAQYSTLTITISFINENNNNNNTTNNEISLPNDIENNINNINNNNNNNYNINNNINNNFGNGNSDNCIVNIK
ncbi:hypothetical protein ACTFIR_004620 [Dictyostelium discoideum]